MDIKVLLVPVALLVHVVLGETQVVPVLLDPQVLLVVMARRESALKERKETVEPLEERDQKVKRHINITQHRC